MRVCGRGGGGPGCVLLFFSFPLVARRRLFTKPMRIMAGNTSFGRCTQRGRSFGLEAGRPTGGPGGGTERDGSSGDGGGVWGVGRSTHAQLPTCMLVSSTLVVTGLVPRSVRSIAMEQIVRSCCQRVLTPISQKTACRMRRSNQFGSHGWMYATKNSGPRIIAVDVVSLFAMIALPRVQVSAREDGALETQISITDHREANSIGAGNKACLRA